MSFHRINGELGCTRNRPTAEEAVLFNPMRQQVSEPAYYAPKYLHEPKVQPITARQKQRERTRAWRKEMDGEELQPIRRSLRSKMA